MNEVQVPGSNASQTPPAPPTDPISSQATTAPSMQPMLPSAGSLFSQAWEIYKTKFNVLFKIYGWTLVHVLAVLVPAGLLFAVGWFLADRNPSWQPMLITVGGVLAIIAFVLIFYICVRMQIGLINAIKHRNQNLTAKQILGMSGSLVWRYFWTSFLVGLFVFLGFVALIIPGIILLVSTALASYIVVDTGRSGWQAIKLSRQYVKGYWWNMLGYLVLSALLGIAISLVSFVPALFLPEEFGSITNTLVSILAGPYFIAYTYLVYETFKKLKPELGAVAQSIE